MKVSVTRLKIATIMTSDIDQTQKYAKEIAEKLRRVYRRCALGRSEKYRCIKSIQNIFLAVDLRLASFNERERQYFWNYVRQKIYSGGWPNTKLKVQEAQLLFSGGAGIEVGGAVSTYITQSDTESTYKTQSNNSLTELMRVIEESLKIRGQP